MPSSRFSGLNLNRRAMILVLIVAGVVGSMAFYRTHLAASAASLLGITTATQAPLDDQAVAALVALDQATEKVAQQVSPAVVKIQVTARVTPGQEEGGDSDQGEGGPGGGQNDPFQQFFGPFLGQMPQQPHIEQGLGSGVIISPDGYIVTNNHVVAGATNISVLLSDQRQFPGKVVGTDKLTDLAVVKINATNLPNAPWGDSRTLQPGENVLAFGNPFGLGFTVTRGIISGLGRPRLSGNMRSPGDFIQTDAAINPGNSGGPLVNAHGEVIGINSAIYTPSGAFSGVGFAIPSEIAKPVIAALIAHGKVVRGYIGVIIGDLDPERAKFFNVPANTKGALVSQVDPNSPGGKAGLKVGDVVVSFNGQKITSANQLQLLTGGTAPNTTVTLGILRNGQSMNLKVTLGELPSGNERAANQPEGEQGGGVKLGIAVTDLTPQIRSQLGLPETVQGVVIERVQPGGPAFNVGLSRGDVIEEVNRHPVHNAQELRTELQKLPPNQDVLLLVYTGGGSSFIVIHPQQQQQPSDGAPE